VELLLKIFNFVTKWVGVISTHYYFLKYMKSRSILPEILRLPKLNLPDLSETGDYGYVLKLIDVFAVEYHLYLSPFNNTRDVFRQIFNKLNISQLNWN
jgi:hypothetical protein